MPSHNLRICSVPYEAVLRRRSRGNKLCIHWVTFPGIKLVVNPQKEICKAPKRMIWIFNDYRNGRLVTGFKGGFG